MIEKWSIRLFVVMWATASIAGCQQGPSDSAIDPGGLHIEKQPVFPLAGTVSIDGRAPQGDGEFIFMLYRPEEETHSAFVGCDRDGRFEFSAYFKGDGMPEGEYIVLIAQLKKHRSFLAVDLVGPDQLGNRFNDPDKNRTIPMFKIRHHAPGKRDYLFDLRTKDVPEVKNPGPHAVTKIKW
jgi:hypothetical protein